MTVWVYLFYGAGGVAFSLGMETKLAPLNCFPELEGKPNG